MRFRIERGNAAAAQGMHSVTGSFLSDGGLGLSLFGTCSRCNHQSFASLGLVHGRIALSVFVLVFDFTHRRKR